MPIQAALHQALGVAPPIAYIPPHLRQQQNDLRQKTLLQRAFNKKQKKYCSSHWATQNLCSGRNSGLQLALLDMRDMCIGFSFLTSTGFTKKKGDPYSDCVIHSKHFEGYDVIATEANSEKQGGVAFAIYNPRGTGVIKPNYHLENVQRHGHNCMSCLYCTGIRKIPVIGAYLLPGPQGLADLHSHVQTAFNQYPTTRYAPAFMGDFNVDLDTNSPNDMHRQQEVLDFLAANGELQSMVPHFKQRRRYEKMGNTTWFQHMADGTTKRSKCDYICCRDRRLFTNVALGNQKPTPKLTTI